MIAGFMWCFTFGFNGVSHLVWSGLVVRRDGVEGVVSLRATEPHHHHTQQVLSLVAIFRRNTLLFFATTAAFF